MNEADNTGRHDITQNPHIREVFRAGQTFDTIITSFKQFHFTRRAQVTAFCEFLRVFIAAPDLV